MAGPVKRTTPCISLQQLSKWIGQLLLCVTPRNPESWDDILGAIPYNTELDNAQVIYEPINLRATLWNIKKKHPLVDLALETMGNDDNCVFLVKDATLPGKHGLFLLYCRLFGKTYADRGAFFSIGEPVNGIYGYCDLGDQEGILFHASQCQEE